MNRETAKDYLPLVQALADGKVIQCDEGFGFEDLENPIFNLRASSYRIKPEPREIWVRRRDDGVEGTFAYPSEAEAGEDLDRNWSTVRYREVLE